MILSVESAAVSFLRRIWMGVSKGDVAQANGILPLEVAAYLQNRKRKELAELERRYGATINVQSDPSMPPGGGTLDFVKSDEVA